MKTKKTALVSALTALALLLAAVSGFPGCGTREEKAPEPPAGDESLVKTGIFTAQDLPMPDGMSFNERIVPFWDPEERTLTFCASETISVDFEDGTFSESEVLYLVTSDAEAVRSKVPLPDTSGDFPTAGTIGEKEAVLVLGTDDRSYRILLFDRERGESSESSAVNSLFPHKVLGICGAVLDRDADGGEQIAVLSQEELVFFECREQSRTESWAVIGASPLPAGAQGESLFRTSSGTILARIYDGGGEGGSVGRSILYGVAIDKREGIPAGSTDYVAVGGVDAAQGIPEQCVVVPRKVDRRSRVSAGLGGAQKRSVVIKVPCRLCGRNVYHTLHAVSRDEGNVNLFAGTGIVGVYLVGAMDIVTEGSYAGIRIYESLGCASVQYPGFISV